MWNPFRKKVVAFPTYDVSRINVMIAEAKDLVNPYTVEPLCKLWLHKDLGLTWEVTRAHFISTAWRVKNAASGVILLQLPMPQELFDDLLNDLEIALRDIKNPPNPFNS